MTPIIKNVKVAWLFLLALFFINTPVFSKDTSHFTPISLQLQWQHQFQFAGFYAAKEKGFYADEELSVEILTGRHHPYDIVESGTADFGVASSGVIVERLKGRPFIALGAVFQNSPYVWLVKADSGIYSVKDFIGKTITKQSESDDLAALFAKEKIDTTQINFVSPYFGIDALINGQIDALISYSSNEPYQLKRKGIAYRTISLKDYDIDFYSDILFTSEKYLNQNPELVEKFRRATYDGWKYAIENPAEIIDLILKKYNAQNKTRDELEFEANTLIPLTLYPQIIPGQMTLENTLHIAKSFIMMGVIKDHSNLNNFLYQPPQSNDIFWESMAKILAITLSIGLFVIYLRSRHIQFLLTKTDLKRLINLFENTPNGVITVNSKGNIENINRAASLILGYEAKEILGKNVDIIIPISLRKKYKNELNHAMDAGANYYEKGHTLETSIQTKKGVRLPIELSLSSFIWNDELFITGIIRNITAKLQEKKALIAATNEARYLQTLSEETSKRLSAIYENMVDGLITIDINGLITSINPAARTLFGYKEIEVLGKNVKILMPAPYKETHDAYLANYRETRIAKIIGIGREVTGLRKDGSTFPMHLAVSEIFFNEQIIYTGIIRDISSQKKSEQLLIQAKDEAERANKAKSEFLSAMSHELRTPLNAILGFSELMLSDEESPLVEDKLDSINYIYTSGQHLLKLVNDVLDLSAIESGQMNLEIETHSPQELIRSSQPLILGMARKRKINVTINDFDDMFIEADSTRFKQILINLISNAIKYNRADGWIKVDCFEHNATYMRTQITDSGFGIPLTKQALVFSSFSRLGQENSTIEGTGIGLIVTKNLVEAMQGEIGFESEEDIGSKFWFDLPKSHKICQLSSSSVEKSDTQKIKLNHSKVKRVLYVEDNNVNIKLMESLFKSFELFSLMSVTTAEEALEQLHNYKPNLILMDINLPGMNGIVAAQKIKQFNDFKNTPIIAVSASAMKHELTDAKQSFDDYVTKPIDLDFLTQLLEKYLLA